MLFTNPQFLGTLPSVFGRRVLVFEVGSDGEDSYVSHRLLSTVKSVWGAERCDWRKAGGQMTEWSGGCTVRGAEVAPGWGTLPQMGKAD